MPSVCRSCENKITKKQKNAGREGHSRDWADGRPRRQVVDILGAFLGVSHIVSSSPCCVLAPCGFMLACSRGGPLDVCTSSVSNAIPSSLLCFTTRGCHIQYHIMGRPCHRREPLDVCPSCVSRIVSFSPFCVLRTCGFMPACSRGRPPGVYI